MQKRTDPYRPAFWALGLAGAISVSFLYLRPGGQMWFYMALGLWLVAAAVAVGSWLTNRRDFRRLLDSLRATLAADQSLTRFPMASMVVDENMEVIWYNDPCRDSVFGGLQFTVKLADILPGVSLEKECPWEGYSAVIAGRMYTVFVSPCGQTGQYLLTFIDDNELKAYAAEYFNTRPSVLLLTVDNYDELFQNLRENERSQMISQIEQLVEQFIEEAGGLLRKLHKDQYIAVIDERYMRQVIESRFSLLDQVRALTFGDRNSPTMSIGVGRDMPTLREAEIVARQALDMALGRGGDQAALKTKSGYEFFGGVSQAVEKRSKVRTRIVANALTELVSSSDKVMIMGHRFSDLDSLGAAAGLAKAVGKMGRQAFIVTHYQSSQAKPLYQRLVASGYDKIILSPAQAMEQVTRKTLLIVVDTHLPNMVESPELFVKCLNVAVIDHHRKMVGHIENAVIFYHEPYASSACEMVAEICQYVGDGTVTPLEAEAMLSGMTLDTKNFTIRTGVRTFEAAAYLRKMGADTMAVRGLFSTSMEAYRQCSHIVASAQLHKGCAIALAQEDMEDMEGMRVVAPQSADELLGITGVDASFVLYKVEDSANISARSMGAVNVQVLLEKLGGGGHLTMAGAQLGDCTLEEAREKLLEAIDAYMEEKPK